MAETANGHPFAPSRTRNLERRPSRFTTAHTHTQLRPTCRRDHREVHCRSSLLHSLFTLAHSETHTITVQQQSFAARSFHTEVWLQESDGSGWACARGTAAQPPHSAPLHNPGRPPLPSSPPAPNLPSHLLLLPLPRSFIANAQQYTPQRSLSYIYSAFSNLLTFVLN